MSGEDKPIGEKLMRNVDDIDLILRQLAEVATVPRSQRQLPIPPENVQALVTLLTLKQQELEKHFQEAQEIASRQELVNALEAEIKHRDTEIPKIHGCLKDAEQMLITAIFQANQKLKSISTATQRKISAEELIKYSHRISASNAVAAPLTWQQGDPERPYPTEVEMRAGWLVEANVPHLRNTLMQAINAMHLKGSYGDSMMPSANPMTPHQYGLPSSAASLRPPGTFMSPQTHQPGSVPTTPTHSMPQPPGHPSGPPQPHGTTPGWQPGQPRMPNPAGGGPAVPGPFAASQFLQQPHSVDPETSVGEMSSDSSDSSSSDSPD